MIIKMRTVVMMSLVLACTFITNAQNNDPFTFGIKAGASRSDITGINSKAKIGPVGGFFTQYKFSEPLAIRSEVLYNAFGAKPKGNDDIRLNYIQVLPGSLRLYPIHKLAIEAGPYASYLLSTKGMDKSNLRKLDYGAAFGVSYDITSQLEIGARYNLGLRDITKPVGKSKNKAIQVTLSYSL
ncbi:porin family protein [Aquimarina sp. MMG016]|uniref:porin family protein n=1 Tax=Aquimarina sp. MMG016 TaxID=2822690 RepID=UPI001B3A7776|nr:porin family protein [Aquimarina sp. MMG016]MBQ4819324.1 PorT family protein [Aquimarina sp. MMG016]